MKAMYETRIQNTVDLFNLRVFEYEIADLCIQCFKFTRTFPLNNRNFPA